MHHINPYQFRFELSVSQSLRSFAMSSIPNTNWFNQFADFLEYEWIRTVPRIEGNKINGKQTNQSLYELYHKNLKMAILLEPIIT